jgi:hypothetical protein
MSFEAKNGKISYNFCGDTHMNCNNHTGSIMAVDNENNCIILSSGIQNTWRTLSNLLLI